MVTTAETMVPTAAITISHSYGVMSLLLLIGLQFIATGMIASMRTDFQPNSRQFGGSFLFIPTFRLTAISILLIFSLQTQGDRDDI